MTSNEVLASDAREIASTYGVVLALDARDDGGWDALVDTAEVQIVVTVVREGLELISFA